MNGNTVTATGLESNDASAESNYRQRIQRATFNLDAAEEALGHRKTHETEEALFQIREARRELGFAETTEERIGGGESVGKKDEGAAQ